MNTTTLTQNEYTEMMIQTIDDEMKIAQIHGDTEYALQLSNRKFDLIDQLTE